MEKPSMKQIKSFIENETGAELAEYAVAVALLVAIALVVYAVLGNAINDQNSGTGAKVKGASQKQFPF
jgi:Flp pilus assembly pilin Flp